MTIRFLLALLLLAGGFTLGAGRFSGKLPGRIIEAKQLPDPVRRFVLQHFPSLNRFSYRWDKRFYYAVNENGGYLLLSADGMLGGFRYHVRQIPREFVDLLPGTSMTYLRERYPNHFLCAFLPIYFGAEHAKTIIDVLPQRLIDGLGVAGGIMPAIGFAVLLKIMMKNVYIPYFILGFVAAAWLKLPVLAIAAAALAMALIDLLRKSPEPTQPAAQKEEFEDGI